MLYDDCRIAIPMHEYIPSENISKYVKNFMIRVTIALNSTFGESVRPDFSANACLCT